MSKPADLPVWRLLNRDGTFNVSKQGRKRVRITDLYHQLLSISWPRFMLLLSGSYVALNALFALAYLTCGSNSLEGMPRNGAIERFAHAFFFSVQTLATIGYGRVTPIGILPNLIMTLEAFVGLLTLALATGLLFARFARPTARVLFSNRALITPHEGTPSFLFRVANERLNQIVDAQITISLAINEDTKEGIRYRNFYDLKLERRHSPLFALSWTIVHPIDSASPLNGLTHEKLIAAEAEFIVTLTGIDDTFSQTIHSRFSYTPADIAWNRQFVDILERRGTQLHIQLEKIHEIE